jgi:hypothetical protein
MIYEIETKLKEIAIKIRKFSALYTAKYNELAEQSDDDIILCLLENELKILDSQEFRYQIEEEQGLSHSN